MVLPWCSHGARMVNPRDINGTSMVLQWCFHGTGMIRYFHGTYVGFPGGKYHGDIEQDKYYSCTPPLES